MTVLEFKELRLNDPVLDSRGRLSKAYDIDRTNRTVKTSHFGGQWRDFHGVDLPGARRKTGHRCK